jgi:hypothetical protein
MGIVQTCLLICTLNLEIRHEVVEWNQLAVSWVQWQALVNVVINIHFHKVQTISEQSNDKWLHKKNCAACVYIRLLNRLQYPINHMVAQ